MSQITKGLSLAEIKKVIVKENNEPLVEINQTNRIVLFRENKFLDPRVRKNVFDLLVKASDNLPTGYKLLVVTAYRSFNFQKELYKQRLIQLAKRYPFKMIFQYPKWIKMVNRYTSPPGGSSHQTGGAVDITIIDSNDNLLDMGTSLSDYGEKVHTENNLITTEQRKNRKILYNVMIEAGFINYPLEWWHYSYGDRMWAAYSRFDKCFYDKIKS
jgi:D-alanyl-D-alanine dipeptidase